ncbi:PREDICTED: uncharacterized protein LOC105359481 [Ceratosolen solmsi marchali]|uniref:Uncharacterized protein LOC105359481 n=1 Tax=Ceratosolen solmsi marchali TaxID=326594 RepID=A0AAJ6YBY4_9HYME|nr:PREDICTED: uncharacterized protein LOC105359481 [Ceratosolen solmsi marchali]
MEAICNGSGPTRIHGKTKGSIMLTFSKSKDIVKPLKIVENGDKHEEVTSEKIRVEMDPYMELEMYLAKVNEEIGEIIESASPVIEEERRVSRRPSRNVVDPAASQPTGTARLVNGDTSGNNSVKRRRQLELYNRNEALNNWSENILAEFNSIIANEISELTKVKKEHVLEGPKQRYRELLEELGISDSGSSADEEGITKDRKPVDDHDEEDDASARMTSRHQYMLNSDYDEPNDQIGSPRRFSDALPEDFDDSFNNTTSDYDEPSGCPDSPSSNELLRSKRTSSSLPSGFNARFALPKSSVTKAGKSNAPRAKPLTDPMPRSSRMLRAFARSKGGAEDPRAQLPPQPFSDPRRKANLASGSQVASQRNRITTSHYGRIQKLKPSGGSQGEPDYEEIREIREYEAIGRSKSLENNMPKSAPSTPTEIKRTPFSRFLKKHKHTPVYKDSSAEAILVRVSSLPDQDLVNLSNDRKDHVLKAQIMSISGNREAESSRKIRAISPLTLRSNITAKRLSESDKDVTRISPVELRKFHVGKSNGNDVAVGCDFPEMNKTEVDGNIAAIDADGERRPENGDVRALADEQNSRSTSLPVSLQSLLSRLTKSGGSCCPNSPPFESLTYSDMATQTSPAISRSSSFTWVSDCDFPHHDARSLQDETIPNTASPQNTVDDDNRSSSSSQDLLQSMDEISSGSLSPDTTDRASPLESGIGTASPPRSTDRRLAKPSTSNTTADPSTPTTYHRKETWERIRRRPPKTGSGREQLREDRDSVWIKRESVHTQTRLEAGEAHDAQDAAVDSSSGLDDSLPRAKPIRPSNLPLESVLCKKAYSRDAHIQVFVAISLTCRISGDYAILNERR